MNTITWDIETPLGTMSVDFNPEEAINLGSRIGDYDKQWLTTFANPVIVERVSPHPCTEGRYSYCLIVDADQVDIDSEMNMNNLHAYYRIHGGSVYLTDSNEEIRESFIKDAARYVAMVKYNYYFQLVKDVKAVMQLWNERESI